MKVIMQETLLLALICFTINANCRKTLICYLKFICHRPKILVHFHIKDAIIYYICITIESITGNNQIMFYSRNKLIIK